MVPANLAAGGRTARDQHSRVAFTACADGDPTISSHCRRRSGGGSVSSSATEPRTEAPASPPPRRSLLAAGFDLVQLGFVFAWTVLCISAALVVLAVTRSRRVPLAMARRLWAPGVLAAPPVRLVISGRERVDWTRPHVFAANHTSLVDIPVLFAALPVPIAFILKKELRRMPFVGWYAAAMGMVFVDRRDRYGARESVDEAVRALVGGRNLVIFPEGTRGAEGGLGAFKSGALAAPLTAGVAVVPVAIHGAGAVIPARSMAVYAGTVRVAIGAPLAVDGKSVDDRAAFAKQVRERVGELLSGLAVEAERAGTGDGR